MVQLWLIYYENKGGIDQFYSDYYEFIDTADENHSFHANNNSHCDLKNCQAIIRNWRDPEIFDVDNTKRLQLYRHSSDENSIVTQQIIDIIHIS